MESDREPSSVSRIPPQSSRRRSLFDFENMGTDLEQPKVISGPVYSQEYIQKVNSEIEEWTQHIESKNDFLINYKQFKRMLKTRTFDESALTAEQLDFLGSVNFDNYIASGTKFLKRVSILFEKNPNKDFNETFVQRLNDIQKKIIDDVFRDVNNV